MKNNDITKLDFILSTMVESNWLVTANDLHSSGYYDEFNDNDLLIERDFKYLLSFFDKTESGDTSYESDNTHVRPNNRTIPFYKNGGFEKYFLDLEFKNKEDKLNKEKELKRQEKQDKKLDIDLYLGDFDKKYGTKFKTWAFAITVFNLLIAIGGVFISNQSKDKSNSQEPAQLLHIENKLKEVEKRILTLERKNDSTYHQKNETNP